jgi:hypothetical protein
MASLAVALMTVGCSSPATGAAGPTAIPSAAIATPPTPAPPPTPVEVQSPSYFPLSDSGPWLVYATDNGLTIANPGGSGRTALIEDGAILADRGLFPSPSGALLALYADGDPEQPSGLALRIISLPHGQEIYSTPLLSRPIESQLAKPTPAATARQAKQAVDQPGSLVWSPDGRRLAFVAALDSASSDLYVYDLDRGQRRRVTSGPNEAASLSWSPDGEWIAYQAVESYRPDGSPRVGSVWAVSPNGSIQRKLFEPGADSEFFVGWSRGDSLLSYSMSSEGPRDLRASGADGAVSTIVVPSGFRDAAYDAESGSAALASDGSGPDPLGPGAYLWNPVGGLTKVDSGDWQRVQWAPGQRRFYFSGPGGVLSVDPATRTAHASDRPGTVLPSPDGRLVAIWGGGAGTRPEGIQLLAPDLDRVASIETGSPAALSWLPDSSGMLSASPEGLFYLPLAGPPILVDPTEPIPPESMSWVQP